MPRAARSDPSPHDGVTVLRGGLGGFLGGGCRGRPSLDWGCRGRPSRHWRTRPIVQELLMNIRWQVWNVGRISGHRSSPYYHVIPMGRMIARTMLRDQVILFACTSIVLSACINPAAAQDNCRPIDVVHGKIRRSFKNTLNTNQRSSNIRTNLVRLAHTGPINEPTFCLTSQTGLRLFQIHRSTMSWSMCIIWTVS
jgi:hypothetical protein